MKKIISSVRLSAALLVLAMSLPSMADKPLMPSNVLTAYQTECASCHMAYPPALLSKSAWQKIMGGLDRHYGADASIDTITQRQIGIWLQTQAGTYKRVEVSSPGERITTTHWFEKKHRKIDKSVWSRQSIKGKAQCQACHTSADIGDFEDERVRIPK